MSLQLRAGDPASSDLPNFPTQRLANPTQPFLALDLDLNESADVEPYLSLVPRGEDFPLIAIYSETEVEAGAGAQAEVKPTQNL